MRPLNVCLIWGFIFLISMSRFQSLERSEMRHLRYIMTLNEILRGI